MTRLSLVLLGILLLALGACASGSSGEGTPVTPADTTPTTQATASPAGDATTTPSTAPTSGCSADQALIQTALDAYQGANGSWPTADGGPGDIKWDVLVPDFLSQVPETDSVCDWQVNSAPEGNVCILDKGSKADYCACASVCTQKSGQVPAAIPTANQPPSSPTPSATLVISSQQVTGVIVWVTDWDEALRLAQSSGKPIFINFFMDTCPYCRKFYTNTLSDEGLGRFLSENFITVRIDTPKSTVDAEYEIKSVPTTVFTDSQGNEIPDSRVVGAKPVDTIRQKAEEVLSSWAAGGAGTGPST